MPLQNATRRHASGRLPALLLTLAVGCGGASTAPRPPAAAPPAETAPAASAGGQAPTSSATTDPFLIPAAPRDEPAALAPLPPLDLDAWDRARTAKGVGPAPASCATVKVDPDWDALAKEKKGDVGLARALRAEVGPIECADAIVDPFLRESRARISQTKHVHLLVGLSLAAKLARTAQSPPVMGAVRDKAKVKAFTTGPLKTWLVEQATLIELLASGAAGLSGYGRGVAAVEAGVAEMRLVDKIRSAPLPVGWDAELKAVYEASLDEALEPRKARGRDAALVGLGDFARLGIVRGKRLERAQAMLSKLYGGRRIDALAGLLLPPPWWWPLNAPPSGPTPSSRERDEREIALQNFWNHVFGNDAHAPDALFPPEWGRDSSWEYVLSVGVSASGGVPDPCDEHCARVEREELARAHSRYARARLDKGRIYWRRVDFVEAAQAAKDAGTPDDRLVLAVALALAKGPSSASEMMRAPSPAALDLTHTEALDALVAERHPRAAMAAFNAAYLRALSPPNGPDARDYFRDLAARFRTAESLLTEPAQKTRAAARAAEIDAILLALAK